MTARIRRAEPRDEDRLAEIARAAYAPYVPLMGRDPPPMLQEFPADIRRNRVWALDDGAVRGYVVAYARGGARLIENLAVAPEAQGKGYGAMLLRFAEGYGAALGHDRAALYTNAAMKENLAIYRHLGYHVVDEREEHGLHRIHFEKALTRDG